MSSPEAPAAARARRGGLVSFLASDTATLFRRWRTWAMLAALALIPILIAIAIRLAGPSGPGRGPAFLDQVAGNGLFVGVTALVVATPCSSRSRSRSSRATRSRARPGTEPCGTS
ncbi:hypothetical protein GCM10025870_20860 [Agromyces marinus]|uniref:Uncharacterized protein n=1 Tax=Agromyces marinus TaxID=1389020 RepID=A0ABN6YHS7_9MICO|nr:hypothetical protein GCM10025870_20860 [Agromyces marinus]